MTDARTTDESAAHRLVQLHCEELPSRRRVGGAGHTTDLQGQHRAAGVAATDVQSPAQPLTDQLHDE